MWLKPSRVIRSGGRPGAMSSFMKASKIGWASWVSAMPMVARFARVMSAGIVIDIWWSSIVFMVAS